MKPKRPYREGSRAARFLVIRDAVLANTDRMRRRSRGTFELALGPFLILYSIPGAIRGRPYNMQIWPAGVQTCGYITQGDKVANVDWDQWDNIVILSFRSGPWEAELLDLLANSEKLEFLPRS